MFATLDPASRRLRFPRDREVIITDTVGFIRDLPKDLVAAFRATLEELVGAGPAAARDRRCGPGSRAAHERGPAHVVEQIGLAETPELLVFNQIGSAAAGSRGLACQPARRSGGLGSPTLGIGRSCSESPWKTACSRPSQEARASSCRSPHGGGEHVASPGSRAPGMYVPERVVTNADLEQLMDTSDEWIRAAQRHRGAPLHRGGPDPGDPGRRRQRGPHSTRPDSPLRTSTASCWPPCPARPSSRGRRSSCTRPWAWRTPPASTCGPSARASCSPWAWPTASIRSRPVRPGAGGGLRGPLHGHRPLDAGPRRGRAVR